ncbi:VRR-NUC domain-containing protein [Meiothermus ruber]|uniref:VRR-NUC domain-containing protein n=1 Tax=Meiothermus ruber TaxID=277 RepID=UPI00068F67A1|nr:VRR-NUC domain-containing protein [Meiothermus ruber]
MKESVLQAKLIARCKRAEANIPDFFWVYSYPAGFTLGYQRDESGRAYSPQAMKAKAMGLKRGLPDIIIDLSKGGYRKGWIELKRPGQRPTRGQLEMHDMLRAKGDWVGVADNLEDAWRMVCEYLGAPLDCWKTTELPEVEGWEGVKG